MADDRAKDIISQYDRLKGDRGTIESHWQEIANYMLPERADYTTQQTPGGKRMQRIFDSTPLWALQTFAAGLHSLLTSPHLQWFALRCDDDRIDAMDGPRRWLDDVSAIMYAIFNGPRHNFASQTHEMYLDLGSIGTSAMAVLEGPRSGILFSTRTMGECVIAENAEDRVDLLSRRWSWTAKQAWQQWGPAAGEKVGKAYADGKYEQKFDFQHSVRPRMKRDPQRADNRNKLFESLYASVSDQILIGESGFDEFPYMAPRYAKTAGEIYGRGPGMTALPDVKMLNEMARTLLKAAQKVVDPPLQAPDNSFIVPIKTVPGSLNFFRSSSRPTDRITPIETGGNIPVGMELIEAVRQQILRSFFVDIFRLPTDLADPSSDGKGSTATYWMQRREKEMMALSPMLARLTAEFLDPLIDRVFNILWRQSTAKGFAHGAPLPPPPPELSGVKLRVEYVSPIAIAQKSSQLDSVNRLIELQAMLRNFDPEGALIIDPEAIMRLTQRDVNAPAIALKSAEQLQQEAQQKAEAQQALNNHAMLANVASAAKDGSAAYKNVADAERPAKEAA
jgi:hypothetical protein